MKVSIITATYNSSSNILDAIKSVQNQTYNNIEHIIIDGGSTDNTLELIRSVNNRVEKIISEPDNGIYDALNKGIALASGEVVGFVHSDDLLASSNVIELIVKTLEETNSDGVYGDLKYVSSENLDKEIRFWKSRPFSTKLLSRGWMPAHPTFFIKKNVYNQEGIFNTKYRISGDYDFMTRILVKNKYSFVYLPTVITKMRVGGVSNNGLKNLVKKSKEDYTIMKNANFTFPLYSLIIKNFSKIPQYFKSCHKK